MLIIMEETVSYICEECRYRFRRKKSWNASVCPYCGKSNACRADDELNKMINEII